MMLLVKAFSHSILSKKPTYHSSEYPFGGNASWSVAENDVATTTSRGNNMNESNSRYPTRNAAFSSVSLCKVELTSKPIEKDHDEHDATGHQREHDDRQR